MTKNMDWKVSKLRDGILPPILPSQPGHPTQARALCKLCGIYSYMPEHKIGMTICACQTARKERVLLTYEGHTLSMADWGKVFGISLGSIRNRNHRRASQNPNMTDAEVIFGRSEADIDLLTVADSEDQKLARGIKMYAEKLVENLIAKSVLPALREASRRASEIAPPVGNTQVVGASLYFETVGVTLSELIETVGIEEAAEFLRTVVYESAADKKAKLVSIIPFVDDSTAAVVDVEVMQLMSYIKPSEDHLSTT